MNAYEKIRAALEQAYKERHEPCSVELRIDEALAALAELERSAAQPAPNFEEPEVTDEMAESVVHKWFEGFNSRTPAQSGHDMIAAVRSELGPTLGLVELREPTPEECADMAEWFKSECQACCINPQESIDYGRAIFDAVKIVMWPKSEGL